MRRFLLVVVTAPDALGACLLGAYLLEHGRMECETNVFLTQIKQKACA